MQKADGMNYAPTSAKTQPVVRPGEFVFSVANLDHGHIYGQTNGLLEAGGTLKQVYEPDPAKLKKFLDTYPQAEPVDHFERILEDPSVHMVAGAAIPNLRGPIGMQVLDAGKDYFVDKSPFTTLDQLAQARTKVAQTGRKFAVYYAERLHQESAWYAGELIQQGAIGRTLQILLIAPHRLNKQTRPEWFFQKQQYGGILTDIGSHQFEQFLAFSQATDAKVNYARVENFRNPEYPELEDFGEASLTGNDGTSLYCRIDWFTPDGLRCWGDGRCFILGTDGFIEIRKYIDLARDATGERIFLVNHQGEQELAVAGKVGFPFFGRLILDVLHRTEDAMTQEHTFKAAELSLKAQAVADGMR